MAHAKENKWYWPLFVLPWPYPLHGGYIPNPHPDMRIGSLWELYAWSEEGLSWVNTHGQVKAHGVLFCLFPANVVLIPGQNMMGKQMSI